MNRARKSRPWWGVVGCGEFSYCQPYSQSITKGFYTEKPTTPTTTHHSYGQETPAPRLSRALKKGGASQGTHDVGTTAPGNRTTAPHADAWCVAPTGARPATAVTATVTTAVTLAPRTHHPASQARARAISTRWAPTSTGNHCQNAPRTLRLARAKASARAATLHGDTGGGRCDHQSSHSLTSHQSVKQQCRTRKSRTPS